MEIMGESIWVRGYLQVVRAKSKTPFFTLRERMATVQAILHESDKFAAGVPKNFVVDMFVRLTGPLLSTKQKDVELNVEKVFVVSKAPPGLSFQVEDATCSVDEKMRRLALSRGLKMI
ncbi:hypothetical protein L915_19223 [Phytophthora nicotianae]|uniref:Aspartyl-tRNA synthetase n=1 Tax=Phytophthora nicotianae TaxID=4792 RepID=W2FVC2_PHYNI|nr:hypothetical protein L915_19223 [Phytophthora nicotianae]